MALVQPSGRPRNRRGAPPAALRLPALLLLAGWLLPVPAALALPAEVLLLRHGRKPAERANGRTINNNLSVPGWQQALHLAQVIPACLVRGRPLRLGSYRFDPLSGANARSYQTLVPLAVASGTNITVHTDSETDSTGAGRRLLADPANDGALVVLAWEHRHLPRLAQGLGWSSMPAVAIDDFDSLWLLRYTAAGVAPQVTLLSQTALDPSRCTPAR